MSVFQGAVRLTDQPTDLTKMTKAQLTALAAERGVEVPKGATKETLVGLLGG